MNEIKRINAFFVISILLFLSSIGWIAAFGHSGVGPRDLMTFNLSDLSKIAYNPSFMLALCLFPVWAACLIMLGRKNESTVVIMAGLLSLLIGATIPALLYPTIIQYWPVFILLMISIPLVVETTRMKFSEVKRYVVMRVVGSNLKYLGLAMAIGFVVLSYWAIESNSENRLIYQQRFREQLLEQVQGTQNGSSDLTDRLAQANASLVVQSQIQTLEQIEQIPAYQKLAQKTGDEDAQALAQNMAAYQKYLSSPAYLELLTTETKKGLTQNTSTLFETLGQQNALFASLEQNIWALHAAFLFGLVTLLTNTLFLLIALFTGYLLSIIQDHFEGEDPFDQESGASLA